MNIFKLTNVPAALFILFCSNVNAQFYNLSTPSTSLVIEAPQNGEAKFIYYGTKLLQNYQKKNWTRLKTPVLIHSQHIQYME